MNSFFNNLLILQSNIPVDLPASLEVQLVHIDVSQLEIHMIPPKRVQWGVGVRETDTGTSRNFVVLVR